MSKAIQKVPSQKQIFSILEAQLKRQDEQGQAIHTMFQGMQAIYGEINEKFEIMTEMVQEVRDTVTLTNAECTMIQSEVASRSNKLAKDRYDESEGKFSAVVGTYQRMIWKQLKEKYGVPKYNCIRRVDFEEAKTFVQDFRPEDYM